MQDQIEKKIQPRTEDDPAFNNNTYDEVVEAMQEYEQMVELEEKFPILKPAEASDRFKERLSNFDSEYHSFITEFNKTPVLTTIQHWLNRMDLDEREKNAAIMTLLINKNIIPSVSNNGSLFTIDKLHLMKNEPVIKLSEEKLFKLEEDNTSEAIDCYVAFTIYLEYVSHGWFKRSLSSISEKANKQTVLSPAELAKFCKALADINYRDYLIALTIFFGKTRVSSVLDLNINQLNFEKNTIYYEKLIYSIRRIRGIEYPIKFMEKLKQYLISAHGDLKNIDHVFVTRNGKKIVRSRLNYSFTEASKQAKIQNVSPEILIATRKSMKCDHMNEKDIINIVNLESPIEV